MRSRPKTLFSTLDTINLLDDLGSWAGDAYDGMSLVGTCNGLIYMWDGEKPDGPITLANPVTGETLGYRRYHCPQQRLLQRHVTRTPLHTTPLRGGIRSRTSPTASTGLGVHTRGAHWRDVATGSPREPYDTAKGVVNIDGTVYWAVKLRNTGKGHVL
jgi:hypothetical protein